jgi:hypothetical protein
MVIYDIDNSWPGSTNDARIWRTSAAKVYLEEEQGQHFYLLAGDAAYPISGVLIKPYSVAEAGRNHRKRLFNQRLSGLRTAMTENVYGVWKRRFPCLDLLRCHLPLAQDIILATAVLHNISIRWKAETFTDDGREEREEEDIAAVLLEEQEAEEHLAPHGDAAPGDARRKALGEFKREMLCVAMPPARQRH